MLVRILLSPTVSRRHDDLAERLAGRCRITRSLLREDFRESLRAGPTDVILATPADLGSDPSAELAALRTAPRPPEVVLFVSGALGPWLAAGAIALAEALAPDLQAEAVLRVVERAQRTRVRPARRQGERLERTLAAFGTRSAAIRRFHEEARRVAASDAPILIRGEPGVGKRWLGPTLHHESSRASESFHRFSFAASASDAGRLALFGHEPGVAPGKSGAGRGLFENSHRGTLFLEHADLASPSLQKDLVEYLERGSIRPLGGEGDVPVDVRLLASIPTTAPDVSDPMLDSKLQRRFDLADLVVPALRQRREDVPELAEAALARCRRRFGLPVEGLSDGVLEALSLHDWPGNLHELWNAVERATLHARAGRIELEHLSPDIREACGDAGSVGLALEAPWTRDPGRLPTLREARARAQECVDRSYLTCLLRATRGRVGEAAQRAGIDPRSLNGLMRRYGFRKEDFKPSEATGR